MGDKKPTQKPGFIPLADLPAPKMPVPDGVRSPAPKMGRPSIYTPELATAICTRLEAGESLRSICRDDAMPDRDTVIRWATEKTDFSNQYATARDRGLDSMAEETLEIADDGSNDWMEKRNSDGSTYEAVNSEHIQRSRLRVDTRKWYLSKLAPKRYGDHSRVEHTGADGKDLPAPTTLDVLEIAKAIGLALRVAAERVQRPGDGALVISGVAEDADEPGTTHEPANGD
jgi:hypothetical protein